MQWAHIRLSPTLSVQRCKSRLKQNDSVLIHCASNAAHPHSSRYNAARYNSFVVRAPPSRRLPFVKPVVIYQQSNREACQMILSFSSFYLTPTSSDLIVAATRRPHFRAFLLIVIYPDDTGSPTSRSFALILVQPQSALRQTPPARWPGLLLAQELEEHLGNVPKNSSIEQHGRFLKLGHRVSQDALSTLMHYLDSSFSDAVAPPQGRDPVNSTDVR